MKIKFSFKTGVVNEKTGKPPSDKELKLVANTTYEKECFADYIIDSGEVALIGLGITGGVLRFELKNQNLYAVVEYDAEYGLNAIQRNMLEKYTKGQLRDGIGENFAQEFVRQTGLLISF